VETLKAIFYIFIGCVAFFMLGAYTAGVAFEIKNVPWYKFVIMGLIALYSLNRGINKLLNK
jgi:hypothetical protein